MLLPSGQYCLWLRELVAPAPGAATPGSTDHTCRCDAELAIEILLNAVALIRERGWQKGTCIREFDCETCMVPLFEFHPQPEMRIHVDAACEPAGPLSLWEAVCVSARRVAAQQQVTYEIMSRVTNMMRGQIGGEYSLVEWVNRLDDSAFPAMALELLQEAADELAGGYE